MQHAWACSVHAKGGGATASPWDGMLCFSLSLSLPGPHLLDGHAGLVIATEIFVVGQRGEADFPIRVDVDVEKVWRQGRLGRRGRVLFRELERHGVEAAASMQQARRLGLNACTHGITNHMRARMAKRFVGLRPLLKAWSAVGCRTDCMSVMPGRLGSLREGIACMHTLRVCHHRGGGGAHGATVCDQLH